MANLFAIVDEKIRKTNPDSATVDLWNEIIGWYDEGGSSQVEANLERKIRGIKSSFSKGVKEIQPEVIVPKKKLRKRRVG